MTGRSVAELERSLEEDRGELEQALAELRVGLQQVTDVRSQVVHYRAEAIAAVERNRDHLTVLAAALGFVAAGGATGAIRLPFKFVLVALGRPTRLEVMKMRQDSYSKQLAGAIVALATADRALRRRGGSGPLGMVMRRGPILLPLLGAAWVYMVSDEERFAELEKAADLVLDRLLPA